MTEGKIFINLLLLTVLTGCSLSLNTRPSQTPSLPHDLKQKAQDIISKALSHPDARIRANAIEVVAATRQLQFEPQVSYLLYDDTVPVRFAAATAIGDLRLAFAEQDLRKINAETQENENVRLATAYALTCLGYPGYQDQLRAGTASQDMTVRANTAMLIGKLGKRELLNNLYDILGDSSSNEKVLMQTIESIALLGDDRIYKKIWAKLISAYVEDRIICIRAMGALGTKQAHNALLTMLSDSIIEVRLVAAEQLGRLGDTSGESVVLAALKSNHIGDFNTSVKSSEITQVRILAASAIGTIRTPSLLRYLPELLNDRSDFTKLTSAKAVLIPMTKSL